MADNSHIGLIIPVKSYIIPNDIGVVVKNITKSKNGQLILTLGNGKTKAKVLKRETTRC